MFVVLASIQSSMLEFIFNLFCVVSSPAGWAMLGSCDWIYLDVVDYRVRAVVQSRHKACQGRMDVSSGKRFGVSRLVVRLM